MVEDAKKSLILIDGSSYLYRAFHALPPLTNSKGQPTGAIYGFISMLRKLLADFTPEYIAIVFDSKEKNFRHELYETYKANRPKMPDELAAQIEPLHEVIKTMGLPLIVINGVEADDVIGTLAVAARQHDFNVLIATGDKDMAQLVDANIKLINTMNGEVLDAYAVKAKFGINPEKIIDYLALVGDSSDNVPGVPGIGPKTAVKLLEEFGSLEEIIRHIAAVPGKVGASLKACLEQLPLAKSLVTLKLDVSLDFTPQELKPGIVNNEKLRELFVQLEFKKWAQGIQVDKSELHHTVLNEQALDELLAKLAAAAEFALSVHTASHNLCQAELVGLSFSVQAGESFYLPVDQDHLVLVKLKPILENQHKIKIIHDIKFLSEILHKYGIKLAGTKFDVMLESYVYSNSTNRHDLATLAVNYLDFTVNDPADIIFQLHAKLWPLLAADQELVKVFTNIEMPLAEVLARMEECGVYIDSDLLGQQNEALNLRINQLEQKAYDLAGEVFNLNSPKQLQEILFDKLKIPSVKKTPGGQNSTAEEVLQVLAQNYQLPRIILEHRSLSKLKSTYTEKLPLLVCPQTQRIHTSYNQAVTATGRLSSTNPNLQNIPIRTEDGRKVRQAFVAPAGRKIVTADYSQIELRVMAHMAQDDTLIRAFNSGEDIHYATAVEVFKTIPDGLAAEYRRRAKTINFGLIYGMSAFGLAQNLNISVTEAQNYIDVYFQRYPGVKRYMQDVVLQAREKGYVSTLLGRRIYVPDINSTNLGRRNAAERAAINAPIQGTAADIIKVAMINLDRWLQTTSYDIKMTMQVHDELVFEVAEQEVAVVIPAIKNHMVQAVNLNVPLVLDVGIGDNWDEAH